MRPVPAPDLADFGPDDFRERLALLCSEWDSDKPLTGLHRGVLFGYLLRHASNRLLIHDTLKRHPEILKEEIDRPVIVTGLPRSGTTHLVNLLAADARFHSLPLWQSYEPVPLPGEAAAAGWHRPALRALRGRLGGHEAGDPVAGRHAPDGAGPHPRGTGAHGAGLRLVQLRVAEHVTALGRALRSHGPDAALPVPEARPAAAAVAAWPERQALGPQVPAAPGAAAGAAAGIPRCDRGVHAPRPGGGDPVDRSP